MVCVITWNLMSSPGKCMNLLVRSSTSVLPHGRGLAKPPAYWPYHRIIEWFGLEGTFRGHLVQHPCSEQGHL